MFGIAVGRHVWDIDTAKPVCSHFYLVSRDFYPKQIETGPTKRY